MHIDRLDFEARRNHRRTHPKRRNLLTPRALRGHGEICRTSDADSAAAEVGGGDIIISTCRFPQTSLPISQLCGVAPQGAEEGKEEFLIFPQKYVQ